MDSLEDREEDSGVHQRLNAFQLRVLAQPSPSIDFKTLQAALAILRADVHAILDVRVLNSEAKPTENA